MDLASEFLRIFSGSKTAHGEFIIGGTKGQKVTGAPKTVRAPLTEDLLRQHFKGVVGMGAIPIDENSTCVFGAVDVDVYEGLDLEDVSCKLSPEILMCRSKSGGMHLFVFTSTPVPAKMLRKKLALIARAVGHPNAEIFPKQETISGGQVGNWINIPYFDGDSTTRYCVRNGLALTSEEFVGLVSEHAMSMQQLVDFVPKTLADASENEFIDAPPCLQELIARGFPPGARNNALFSMGVYARKKFPTGWEDKVSEYNLRFMGPGTYSEVAGIIRSLGKTTYAYKCKDQPLSSVCDKTACLECTYGIVQKASEERTRRPCVLERVIKARLYKPPKKSRDDPYWVFEFDTGEEMEVTMEVARSQTRFATEYMRQFFELILPVKEQRWCDALNKLIKPLFNQGLEIQDQADDAGPEGQMWIYLEDFCTNKSKARAKDELLLGKPWLHDSKTYFRLCDFTKYLDQQRFRALTQTDITKVLKRRGGKDHKFLLKGKETACWGIPSFNEQNEDFDPVVVPNETDY